MGAPACLFAAPAHLRASILSHPTHPTPCILHFLMLRRFGSDSVAAVLPFDSLMEVLQACKRFQTFRAILKRFACSTSLPALYNALVGGAYARLPDRLPACLPACRLSARLANVCRASWTQRSQQQRTLMTRDALPWWAS